MRKSLKVLAAAIAVSAVISSFSIVTSASYEVTTTYISEDSGSVTGGWEINSGSLSMSKNTDAKKAFKKAAKKLVGVKYQAVALLARQVVAGTNYCILVRSKASTKNANTEIKLMYIYEDLQGNAEITGFKTIIGELLPGGFSANTGELSISKTKNPELYKAYKAAVDGLVGVDYKPVAYLGSQVVAGMNHLILCRSKVVYPDAPYKFSLVKVYQDLSGNLELLDISDLGIGEYDDDEGTSEDSSGYDGMANPWQEYKTVKEAAKAAGVSFNAPKALGSYKISGIQAMKGIVEVNYSNGKKEICVRKGTGTDDISGDYNEYENTVKNNIAGINLTVRMNGKKVYSVIWDDGKNSYSYSVSKGISSKTALKHITSVVSA